jgi:hypothetical protein
VLEKSGAGVDDFSQPNKTCFYILKAPSSKGRTCGFFAEDERHRAQSAMQELSRESLEHSNKAKRTRAQSSRQA